MRGGCSAACVCRLSEREEEEGDQRRRLSMLQVRARYLEEENSALQNRVDSLIRQKHNLDRVVKDYQLDRHTRPQVCMGGEGSGLGWRVGNTWSWTFHSCETKGISLHIAHV